MAVKISHLSWAQVAAGQREPRPPVPKSYCAVARAALSVQEPTASKAAPKRYAVIRAAASSPVDEALQGGDEETVRSLVLADPGVINQGNEWGLNLVSQLCYQGGSAALLEFLLEQGGEANVLSAGACFTPFSIAKGRGHTHLLPHLPGNCSYSALIHDSKTLGHLFELSGSIDLEGSGQSFSVEGYWSRSWIDLFQKGIKNFEKYGPARFQKVLKEIQLHLDLLKSDAFNLSLCQGLLDGDSAFVLDSGWLGHSIFTLFWRSYFIVCDPSGFGGMPTIKVHKIDVSFITQEAIDAINWMCENGTSEEGIAYFTRELPDELGALEANLTPKDEKVITAFALIAPRPIEVGICSFASLSTALSVIGTIEAVAGRPDVEVSSAAKRVSCEIKRVRTYMQGEFLFSYLCRYKDHPSLNKDFVTRAYQKLTADLHREFPHVHDVKFETPSGVIRGDELLVRISRMLPR